VERESRRWVGGSDGSTHLMAANEAKMKNALSLFLDHPQWLVAVGTPMLVLGLTGLALFSARDVDSAEDPVDDRPKLSDKETQ
jgi:hypothetical protein